MAMSIKQISENFGGQKKNKSTVFKCFERGPSIFCPMVDHFLRIPYKLINNHPLSKMKTRQK